jgi:hypothetical protein
MRRVAGMRMRACALSVCLLGGCSFGSESEPSTSTRPAQSGSAMPKSGPELSKEPIQLRPTPAWVKDACGGFPASNRRFCPASIPVAGKGELTMSLVFAKRTNRVNLMQLQAGQESFGDERRNRPPSLAAVLLVSGDLQQALAGLLPPANSTSAAPIRDGLANMARTKPLSLGPKRWAGLEGELALAPSRGRYPLAYFRYVFFRWRDASGAHAFGLRAWEPFTESVRTLRALITRLRPVAARRVSHRENESAPGGVPLARSPAWLLAACRALRTRPICPGRIPAAHVSSLDLFFEPSIVGPGGRQDWLSVEWGVPHGDTANNRPPGFLHLDLRAGALPLDKRFQRPSTSPRDGLFLTRAGGPMPLGHPRWAGRNGVLVLGDCFGNHLCFRWRQQGIGYQIDLHGWEPFTQTVSTLHAIVASLPPSEGIG